MTAASASDHPTLPARTAAQLLTALQQNAGNQAFSGTVKSSPKLGLPSIPEALAAGGGFSVQSLLTKSNDFRVWADGPDRQRLALIGDMAENDVIHNGADLWTYDSLTSRVTHTTLTSPSAKEEATKEATAPTPAEAADTLLKAIDPTTLVTVDRTARVAGRPAYQLVLQPRDNRTLVRKVSIALDSKTMLPLRLQVMSQRSTKPAFEVAFTSIHFGTPSASIFNFHPPRGATSAPAKATHSASKDSPRGGMHVIGSGWTAVLALDAGALDPATRKTLDHMVTHTPAGGVITTALVSVLFANDGTIYVASLNASDLETVAATGHAL